MAEANPKNFFQWQEEARASSLRLIPLFFLALLGVIGAVYTVYSILAFLAGAFVHFWMGVVRDADSYHFDFLSGERLGWISLIVTVLFCINSIRKTRQLREGGRAVARLLGAKRVNPGTEEPDKRRLLNVVEELSVASGVPVPDVYILERETSINAFVAGYAIDDMIVGATGGSVKYLTRDELQGIIAHEYSHIFNGDMALKMRLMGWVHGLFAVTAIADWVMDKRNAKFDRDFSTNQSVSLSPGDIITDLVITFFGFILSFIGWHGAVFGRMIKAAVSRQREHLADAAAIQFTRYPEGLAGAFEKVHKWPDGSKVVCPHAEETSHMFFADALQGDDFFLFLSTHPPIEQRIKRVRNMMGRAPSGEEVGKRDSMADAVEVKSEPKKSKEIAVERPPILDKVVTVAAMEQVASPVAETLSHIGMPLAEHLIFATKLLESLPAEIKDATHDSSKAQALVFGLLMGSELSLQNRQREMVSKEFGEETAELALSLYAVSSKLPAHARVPLIELSLPALREMSADDFKKFDRVVRELVEADQELDVFEFALQHILRRHLGAHFQPRIAPDMRFHSVKAVAGDVAVLLTALAAAGLNTDAERAFAMGVKSFNSTQLNLRMSGQCTLHTLESALGNIRETGPSVRRSILQACAEVVAADGVVHPAEGELLRAVADALECPMPPLIKTN